MFPVVQSGKKDFTLLTRQPDYLFQEVLDVGSFPFFFLSYSHSYLLFNTVYGCESFKHFFYDCGYSETLNCFFIIDVYAAA